MPNAASVAITVAAHTSLGTMPIHLWGTAEQKADWLPELCSGRNPRPREWITKIAQHPKLVDIPNQPDLKAITRYACKMATGSGKTVVMAMLIAWAFCNRGTKPGDPRFPRRSLVICPNLTIRERLSVLRPGDPRNYYEKFDLVPTSLRPELAKGKVHVTNWHWFSPESEVIKVGGLPVAKLGAETPEAFAKNRLGDLWDTEPLMVLNDEGHHAYRPAPVGEDQTLTSYLSMQTAPAATKRPTSSCPMTVPSSRPRSRKLTPASPGRPALAGERAWPANALTRPAGAK